MKENLRSLDQSGSREEITNKQTIRFIVYTYKLDFVKQVVIVSAKFHPIYSTLQGWRTVVIDSLFVF